MRIGVNTRLLLKNKLEGIGRFTVESLQHICESHPEHDFFFFFDREFDPSFIFSDNITPIIVGPQARHPILWKIWFDWQLPRLFKKHNIDIFYSPDGYLSKNTNIPQVNVIHDLNFEHQPKDVPGWAGKYLRKEFPIFAKKATRLLTVSEFSKQDLVNLYQIAPEKIDVCYNGVSDSFTPIQKDQIQQIREKYSKGKSYFLYLGAIHPRKNIVRMLQAFEQFKRENQSDLNFVLAGKKMHWTKEMEAQLKSMKYASDVIFTGHIPEQDLNAVYGSSEALLYLSYFEGFGIPMIEAMKSGVPVLASNKTCLPEIAGDAALYADPYNADDICKNMLLIQSNTELKNSLIEKGLQKAKEYSWERTANIIWNNIEKAYAESL